MNNRELIEEINRHIDHLEVLFEDLHPFVAASNALELLDHLRSGIPTDKAVPSTK